MIGVVAISIDTIVDGKFWWTVMRNEAMVTKYVRWAARLLDIEALEASHALQLERETGRVQCTRHYATTGWNKTYTFKMLSCLYQIQPTFLDGGSITQRSIHYKTFSRLVNDVKRYTLTKCQMFKFHCIIISFRNLKIFVSRISREYRKIHSRTRVETLFLSFLEDTHTWVHYRQFNYSERSYLEFPLRKRRMLEVIERFISINVRCFLLRRVTTGSSSSTWLFRAYRSQLYIHVRITWHPVYIDRCI